MMMLLNEELARDCFYQVNKENTCKELNSQMYIWNEQNNTYYKIGEIGTVIWEYCKYPISEQQIVAMLMEDYEVSKEECEQQVEYFLAELLADNLLVKVDLKGCLE
ncbi:hypothetical protein CHH55_10005 [Niallia circulans]|jgi:Coenzyme PQQ synthesis protein D (PqqD)|nr:PqqD family peptide modification chaperone [Niallia circulans]MCM2983548.1 PqqD family peptide modification chaperone [Niallia circulans]PAD26012.1 hypothetical protein CHH62_09145 [Niallia circulans]PAD88086.1 hypothetical protein CHH55_10005 [Niallia circulans]